MSEEAPKEASFNQAYYQQMRIHERFQTIDRLWTNPIQWNNELGDYNFKIIFNELSTSYATMSSKFSQEDDDLLESKREEIVNFINNKPIFYWNGRTRDSMKKFLHPQNWDELNNLLFKFRKLVEKMMDKYGYGNPTKDNDPRKRYGK